MYGSMGKTEQRLLRGEGHCDNFLLVKWLGKGSPVGQDGCLGGIGFTDLAEQEQRPGICNTRHGQHIQRLLRSWRKGDLH